MAISQLTNPVFTSVTTADGSANAGGFIYVYTVNGTYDTPADQVTVWSDKAKTSALAQPITLNSAGQAEIWFNGTASIRIEDSSGAHLDTIIGVESSPTVSVSGEFNLVTNGSFEIDTNEDGSPDGWSLSPETSAVISIDSTSGNQTHGSNSLHFDSTLGTAGGGTAISDLFAVETGNGLTVSWSFKQAGAADGSYKVDVLYYDSDGDYVGTDNVWDYTGGAAPTSWTQYSNEDGDPVVDAGATQARIQITGLGTTGTNKIGECWFDNISCIDPLGLVTVTDIQGLVTETGTQTLTNKTIGTGYAGGVITLGTANTAPSGSSIEFNSIPSWVKKITLSIYEATVTSSPSTILFQVGNASAWITTGYTGGGSFQTQSGSGNAFGDFNGCFLTQVFNSGNVINGTVTATKMHDSGGTDYWMISSICHIDSFDNATDLLHTSVSGISTATLTRVRLNATLGTFTAGTINILYEG